MTFDDDRDSELEELLRASLHGEADGITPSGDGLSRIQQRVSTRRSRSSWLRPVAAAGAVAVVGGAGAVAYALSRPAQHHDTVTTSPTASNGPTAPAVTPSSTPTQVAETFPNGGMFPYTSDASERMGTVAWANDPVQVAVHFVSDFAGVTGVDELISKTVHGDEAAVTLGRTANNTTLRVTTVQLFHYDHSWIVIGADDPSSQLVMTMPAAGAHVGTPIVVSGPGYGVDESVQLSVRSLHSSGPLGSAQVSFGAGVPTWTQKVRYTAPADAVGAVVAYETSMMDGGPQRLVVNAVRFSAGTVQAAGYPRYFYGVKNGQVTKYASSNGASLKYLTTPQPGGGASDPQLVGNQVYYLAGAGTCANTLSSVSVDGGTSDLVATPQAGYVISGYGVSADGKDIALFERACQGATQPQGLLVSSVVGTATTHSISFPGFPPLVVDDPTWEPDGQHLDAVVLTGNMSHVARYAAFTASSWSDESGGCTTNDGLPQAVSADANGTVWFATQTGSSISVLRCTANSKVTPAFEIAGNVTPVDLSVTQDGQAVLVSDDNGSVWRWTAGSNAPTRLTPAPPQSQIGW